MTLDEAVAQADLPGLVARYFPDSGAVPGRSGTVRATWRGDERPSFSLYRAGGRWLFRDHATGQRGNAWHFLTEIVGLSEREALEVLGVGSPQREAKTWVEEVEEAQERLKRFGKLPEEMAGRGFLFEELLALGFGLTPEGTVIPIRSPEGRLVAAKVRRRRPPPKYRYLREGMRALPWYSPGFGQAPRPVLVVEGELNAAIAHLVYPEMDYVGVAGAESSPEWAFLRERKVYLAADRDEAGTRALERWTAEAEREGIFPLPLPPLDHDFCEVAGTSREELKGFLMGLKRYRFTEAIGLEEDIAALRARLPNAVRERRVVLGLWQGKEVYRASFWFWGNAPVVSW